MLLYVPSTVEMSVVITNNLKATVKSSGRQGGRVQIPEAPVAGGGGEAEGGGGGGTCIPGNAEKDISGN